MAKALPKINDVNKTPMKEVLGKDGEPKKGRGRPKKFQTLAEVEADINLREYQKLKKKFDKLKASKKAKITPAKISPTFYPLDAGLKLEEENKVQTEKITKIISIQKLHKENHQKEKSEIDKIFTKSNGVMFAHGFENLRNNNYLVRKFEKKICQKLNVKYCLPTTSGTMAQYIAMKALGIKRGDQVITQSFTFVATVEAILALGAKPVILNVDKTLNMDLNELKKIINKKTKLIIPVPMLGNPTRIDKINKIAKKYNIPVIEDACESLGAKYKGKFVGTTSDIGIYSLDFAKTITTGEGGLIVTNSKFVS